MFPVQLFVIIYNHNKSDGFTILSVYILIMSLDIDTADLMTTKLLEIIFLKILCELDR